MADEFRRNFADRGDAGAAFAAWRLGQLVVDLWGGLANGTSEWREDTVGVIFSGSKGLVALCMHMLADRDLLDVNAPVSKYWPEFVAHGKDRVLVGDIMTHQARLPGVRAPLGPADLVDGERIARLLADQGQENDERAAFCYHPLTYGWLCAELVRRIDGRSIGRFFAEEVAEPLALDAWIGLPSALEYRVARLVRGPMAGTRTPFSPWLWPGDALFQTVWANPPLFEEPLIWNAPWIHAAEIPGVNAIGSARALAQMYCCLACGGRLNGVQLISESALTRAREERVRAHDAVQDHDMVLALGFMLQPAEHVFGPPSDAFGHDGAGGSRHGAWPTERVGFSYVMNQMRDDQDDRGQALLNALYDAVQTTNNAPGNLTAGQPSPSANPRSERAPREFGPDSAGT